MILIKVTTVFIIIIIIIIIIHEYYYGGAVALPGTAAGPPYNVSVTPVVNLQRNTP